MKSIFTIILLIATSQCYSQNYFDFEEFNNSISFDRDTSLANVVRTANSIQYDFQLVDRKLEVKYEITDWMFNSYIQEENEVTRYFEHAIPIDSIDDIKISTMKFKAGCDTCYIVTSSMTITAVNRLMIFEGMSDGYKSKLSMVTVPINRLPDTTKFIRVVNHVKELQSKSVELKPSCKIDTIQFDEGYPIWTGVKQNNLEVPLKINGKEIEDKEHCFDLIKMIEELKIESLTYCIVIDENSKIIDITIYEFEIRKKYNDVLANMEKEERQNFIKGLGIITEEEKEKLEKVIHQQTWTTGKCGGSNVKTIVINEFNLKK